MNFSHEVKSEILAKPIKERCCKKAFLAGLIRGTGEIYYDKFGDLGLDFKVTGEETANIVSDYFFYIYGYEIREVSVVSDKLNKKDKFVLSVCGEKAADILKDLDILIEKDGELAVNLKFYGRLTEKECCLRAFFKGLYLSVGSCTVPQKDESANTRYHLELCFSHSTPATDTAEILSRFLITAKVMRRKGGYIVYVKSVEEIKNFFAFLGAPVSVLKLTDLIINAELNNISNRRRNCDINNVNKQVAAAEKQITAIEKIEKTVGLSYLKKEDLILTAKARTENPEETLGELAERLNVTKSCLNHRLRKIVALSENIAD